MRLVSPWKQAVLALIVPGILASTGLAAPAGWSLKYGSGPSEVGYYNAKVNPKIEEASPLGPLAFRIVGGDLWIADSIGGRVLQLGSNGAVKASIRVPGVGTDTLLEDIALSGAAPGKPDAVWVADGADLIVRKLAVPAGTELMRVGGRGENPGQFAQIHQVETGPTGRLYIGDYGRSVIAVFSPEGKLLREHPWERSGFVIDDRDRLSTVVFIEGAGYVWQRYDAEGRLERSVHLGLQGLQNPRVWWNEADGGLSVSFIPAGGFRGSVTMHVFSADGAVLRKYPIRPAAGMNRYVDRDGSSFWTATADVDAAPAGAFRIEPLTTDGEARPASKKQAADPWAALKITRKAVVKLPAIDPSTLIGIRTEGANGFLLARDGTLTNLDLSTGKTSSAAPFT
ncbi:MAG TPA: hypothetical protein VIV61_13970, partial [Candidatus Ozemobacteraceae bacterium]